MKLCQRIQTSVHRLKSLSLIVILLSLSITAYAVDNVYGHGVGSETFPPVELDGRFVTLEVSSSQSDPNTNDDQLISISLIDFDSKITLRDVTFLIKSERGEEFLFEDEFNVDNGFIVFNFISENTESIIVEEETENNFFGSLIGLESRMVHVKGPNLSEGGLYKFDVSVLAADGYSKKLDKPLVFNAGISIAQTSTHTFTDPNFGNQSIDVITYYDEISDFNYDPTLKEISFFMPFEWSESNINQTSVVHEEIRIPKEFGDLLVSGFTMYLNGIKLSEDIVNIDDFFSDARVVHFIIYQKELLNVLQNNSNPNGMDFLIKPDRDYTHLSSVTDNGQFRVLTTWEPEHLKSNSKAKIVFDITDIFLKNKPVATNYELSITQNNMIIFEQSGISTDSREEHNVVEFTIPENITGIVNLNFKNLDNNNLAKTTFPIVIDRMVQEDSSILIPVWIKNNAEWWSQGQIDDDTFIQAIEYLIKNKFIIIPDTVQETTISKEIPVWIKNNAEWWSQGQIDDNTFIQGLQFLIQNGIIQV